jgi:hypothetical protein
MDLYENQEHVLDAEHRQKEIFRAMTPGIIRPAGNILIW